MDEWVDIPGYYGYQVSDMGEVRSVSRTVLHGVDGSFRRLKGRMLKKTVSNVGYYYVSISVNGKVKKELVHRLVCLSFWGEPEEGSVVNHRDGNKLNNKASNVEWCSQAQNNKHAYDNGLRSPAKNTDSGAEHASFKSPIQAENNGFGYVFFGRKQMQEAGFLSQSVYACCNGKLKTHKGFSFERVCHGF